MEQEFEDAMRNPAFALAVSSSGGNLDPLRMYDWLTRMRARLDPQSGLAFDNLGTVVRKLHETCLMVSTEINLSAAAYRGSSYTLLLYTLVNNNYSSISLPPLSVQKRRSRRSSCAGE